MKLEAPLRQLIERRAGAPVEGQKPAGLAGSRRGYLGPLHDDDLDPAATEEIRCTGADYTAAADSPSILEAWSQPRPSSLAIRSPDRQIDGSFSA
jgi:hypothetical protein